MRRIVIFVSAFILYFANISFAGSVPEELFGAKDARLFFGRVEKTDGNDIILVQKKNVKGDFTKDSKIKYNKYYEMGEFDIQNGSIYLCGGFEGGEVYIWKTSNLDPKTMKIIAKDDMSRRLQELISSGKFDDGSDVSGNMSEEEMKEKKDQTINFFLGLVFTVIVIVFVIDKIKNKKIVKKGQNKKSDND